MLEACRQNSVAWVPYFPLGSAMPGREKVTDDLTVQTVAAEVEATPAQVGLAWLLAEYEHTLLIPGTSDPTHLAENIAAGELRLPPEALEALSRVARAKARRRTDPPRRSRDGAPVQDHADGAYVRERLRRRRHLMKLRSWAAV